MDVDLPPSLAAPHAAFAARAIAQASGDARIAALLAGGSWVHGGLDAHSDLDLVAVTADRDHDAMMAARFAFARALGDPIAAFTGEHVGEPRLLICLYGPPLLHVDIKFVRESDLGALVERPAILFARDPRAIAARLDSARIAWPDRDADWFEARAWIWLHYGATKLARGELIEAIGMLAFFREQVLGPMLHRRARRPQRGVRRIEAAGLDPDGMLAATIPAPDRHAIADALRRATALYVALRGDAPPAAPARAMPAALLAMIEQA